VERTTQFKRAGMLEMLTFEIDIRARPFAEHVGAFEWRTHHRLFDPAVGVENLCVNIIHWVRKCCRRCIARSKRSGSRLKHRRAQPGVRAHLGGLSNNFCCLARSVHIFSSNLPRTKSPPRFAESKRSPNPWLRKTASTRSR